MLKNDGHIDKLFSEGLKDLSVQPRAELWDKIQADVAKGRQRKRAVVLFISLGIAASLALLFTLSNNNLFQQDIEFKDSELLSNLETNSGQAVQELTIEKPVIQEEKLANVILKKNINHIPKKEHRKVIIDSKSKWKREVSVQMVLPKSKNKILENMPLSMKLLEEKNKEQEKYLSVLEQDSLIIAHNLKMIDQFNNKHNKKNEWSILGQVSSAYSSYTGEKSGGNSENGLISIGGGVKVNWQTSKKLAIQTGIIYNKFGQKLNNQAEGYESASASLSSDLVAKNRIVTGMETSAGPIRLKASSVSDASNQFYAVEGNSSSSDMIQSFEAIEIPFILRYNLIDKKFGLHLSGGLSTNLMIGNRIYDKSSKRTLGETAGIRTTNFSTSFSLGMEYRLNSKFSLSMEPSVKYYLNSINKASNFNYKPYSIGLNSGIRYKF